MSIEQSSKILNYFFRELMKRLDHIYNAKLALSFFNSILSEFLEEAKYYLSVRVGDLRTDDIESDQKMKLNFKNFVVKTDDFEFAKKWVYELIQN